MIRQRLQEKAWERTKRKFSCKCFFEQTEKKKLVKKYYVNEADYHGACEPDFVQSEDSNDFAPMKHLIECHGFMQTVPEKKRRSLEIMLCKLIEKSMYYIDPENDSSYK